MKSAVYETPVVTRRKTVALHHITLNLMAIKQLDNDSLQHWSFWYRKLNN